MTKICGSNYGNLKVSQGHLDITTLPLKMNAGSEESEESAELLKLDLGK
jgi:hypothetical protein